MSVILENQAKQIISEANSTNANGGAEQWAGVALPLVRKVFAQIAAKDFVSVQPMNLPSGLVFYLDFKYGTAANGRSLNENMYGNVSTANDKMGVDEEVSGGLYGAGQFGYTINSSSAPAQVDAAAATSASIGYQDGTLPSAYQAFTVSLSGTGFDSKGVRAFRLLSGSVDVTSNPEWTTVSGNNVTFVVAKTTAAAAALTGSVVYHKQPTDNARGDFEFTGGVDDRTPAIPEINVSLASTLKVAEVFPIRDTSA